MIMARQVVAVQFFSLDWNHSGMVEENALDEVHYTRDGFCVDPIATEIF
jgi:hypothetical protein